MKDSWVIIVNNTKTGHAYGVAFRHAGHNAGQSRTLHIKLGDKELQPYFSYCTYNEYHDIKKSIFNTRPTRFRKIKSCILALELIRDEFTKSNYILNIKLVDDKTMNTISFENMRPIRKLEYTYLDLIK